MLFATFNQSVSIQTAKRAGIKLQLIIFITKFLFIVCSDFKKKSKYSFHFHTKYNEIQNKYDIYDLFVQCFHIVPNRKIIIFRFKSILQSLA